MGATLGPAIVGEWLEHAVARNAAQLSSALTDINANAVHLPLGQLYGLVSRQALMVSMKEIYGYLLIMALISLLIISLSYSNVRPWAIFPKWRTVYRRLKRLVKTDQSIWLDLKR